MNKKSSRSHAILQILIEQKWIETETGDPSTTPVKKVNFRNKTFKFKYFLSSGLNKVYCWSIN